MPVHTPITPVATRLAGTQIVAKDVERERVGMN